MPPTLVPRFTLNMRGHVFAMVQYHIVTTFPTVKWLLKKAQADNRDPYLVLLDRRNTPTESLNSFPVQRLMGRRTRTLVWTLLLLLEAKLTNNVQELLTQKKELNKPATTIKGPSNYQNSNKKTSSGWDQNPTTNINHGKNECATKKSDHNPMKWHAKATCTDKIENT